MLKLCLPCEPAFAVQLPHDSERVMWRYWITSASRAQSLTCRHLCQLSAAGCLPTWRAPQTPLLPPMAYPRQLLSLTEQLTGTLEITGVALMMIADCGKQDSSEASSSVGSLQKVLSSRAAGVRGGRGVREADERGWREEKWWVKECVRERREAKGIGGTEVTGGPVRDERELLRMCQQVLHCSRAHSHHNSLSLLMLLVRALVS